MSEATMLGSGGTDSPAAAAPAAEAPAANAAPASASSEAAPAAASTEAPKAGDQPAAKTDAAAAPKAEAGSQPPAAKPGEAAAGDGESKPDEKAKDANPLLGAPEGEYEAFTAPEGVALNESVVGSVKTLAKELGLSQAGAQLLTSKSHEIIKAINEGQADIVKTASKEWADAAFADKELGGTKENFDKTKAFVARARQTFVSDGLKKVFDDSGLGNHPEMLRMMSKIGKAMTEDTVVNNDAGAHNTKPSLAQRLYGKTTPQPQA